MIRPGIRRLFRLWIRTRETGARDADLEIQSHLDFRAEQLVREGWPPDAARKEALRRFGALDHARRALHRSAERRDNVLNVRERIINLLDDIRITARGLRHDGAFTAFVVVTLALGIGANAAMFGIADRLLLRGPAHVRDADGLARVFVTRNVPGMGSFTTPTVGYAFYDHVRKGTRAFEGLAAQALSDAVLGRGADAREIRHGSVTASFFPLLGVQPALGRFFTSAEDSVIGAERVAVLGYALWRGAFAGDRDVMGRAIVINDESYTVIGVAPAGFTGVNLERVDAWLPLSVRGPRTTSNWTTTWNSQWMSVVGRLKPGVALETAGAEATVAHRTMFDGDDKDLGQATVFAAPLRTDREGNEADEVAVTRWLVGVSAIVLLIACANVTNLILARGVRRRRDIAVRAALGAGRGRLVRLILIDSAVLASAGAVAGLAVAFAVSGLVKGVLLPQIEWGVAAGNARMVLAAAGIAVLTGLLVAVLPALHGGGANLSLALKAGAREGGGRHARLRGVLTVAQAALSVVLLVGAGLFVRSLWNAYHLDLGMEPHQVLTVSLRWPRMDSTATADDRRRERTRRETVHDEVLERLRGRRDVEHAALIVGMPFRSSFGIDLFVTGWDSIPLLPGGGPYVAATSDDYFSTMRIRLLRGEAFGPTDGAAGERVVIVNETMASVLWPGKDAIGQCIRVGGDTMPCARVVGITGDTRRFRLREERAMQYYIPYGQQVALGFGGTEFVIRPRGEPGNLMDQVRRTAVEIDPSLTYVDGDALATTIAPQYQTWRLGATVFVLCGVLALLVAAVGMYSVLAYLVTQRTREIGVRVALGARAADIARLIVRSGVGMAAGGVVIGIVLAMVGGRFIQDLLFDTSPRDPMIFAGVAAAMLAVATVASLLPAAAARRVDPVVALRAE